MMRGILITEVRIEIPEFEYHGFEFTNNFEIFPLLENVYAIHIQHDLGRHIQIINLLP